MTSYSSLLSDSVSSPNTPDVAAAGEVVCIASTVCPMESTVLVVAIVADFKRVVYFALAASAASGISVLYVVPFGKLFGQSKRSYLT